jgi:hypothetical protein
MALNILFSTCYGKWFGANVCYFVLFFCIEIAKYKYEQKALEQRATVLKLYDILIKMKALEQRATVLKLYDIVH